MMNIVLWAGLVPESDFRKGGKKMNKLVAMVAVVFVLSLGLAASSQAKSMGQGGLTIYDSFNLVGKMVKSPDGVELGKIFDLVVDSRGHVDFAIISQPGLDLDFSGRLVAVPFTALKISEGRSQEIHVVLIADKEKFYEAPSWGQEDLANRQQAASLDRYFGVRPYWTEKNGKVAAPKEGVEKWHR